MDKSIKKYTLFFNRLLFEDKKFILENKNGRYYLTTGISEYYILLNLDRKFKRDGKMIIQIGEQKGESLLLPVAILHNQQPLWITVTEDENTVYPELSELSILNPFETRKGEEYPDGFIDSTRTMLSYNELIKFESTLHTSDYALDFYVAYINKYPDCLYDVRLHYFMIKNIRKHKYYTDDFCLPCNAITFYQGWKDPFPWYLYVKTFGGMDTWPSYARMRLMAENNCWQGVPMAIKVLKNGKANNRICHYAILIAGLYEVNDELIKSYIEKCPRAIARLWYERKSSQLFPMLLENAHRILKGSKDDILDDLPETYMPDHNEYKDYTINHRGYITLQMLTIEQVRELWTIYRQIAQAIGESKAEEKRLRLGNAFRAFMMALVYNTTKAVGEIMQEIYNEYNYLLYSEWSQDSHFKQMDIMWADYLYRYIVSQGILDNFWLWLQHHAKKYDSYYLYTNQRFFLMIYSKIAYYVLPPETLYDALSRLIDSNHVLVESVWTGITNNTPLEPNSPPLDHRWENMFCNYNYYVWTRKAYKYYELIKPLIQPHPEKWTVEKWMKDLKRKKKLNIVVPL